MVILTVSGNPQYALKKNELEAFCDAVKSVAGDTHQDLSIVLRIRQIAKGKPTQVYDMVVFGKDHVREKLHVLLSKERELEVHIGTQSFFQPNTTQAEKIYGTALSFASLGENDTVLDLYCGIGMFGMFAALEAKRALGIELSREAAYDATINAQRLGFGNFSVYAGDVASVLRTLPESCPDIVIVDPPRAGLQKAIEQIVLMRPRKLVYVSCNPKTQVEDILQLKTHGWEISAMQAIDQFPHTVHVENIVLLERKR